MTLYTPYPRPDTSSPYGTSYVSSTLRLSDPASDVLVRHVRLLRDCVALARQRWNFEIEAAAVLPGEMHMLCRFDGHEFAVGGALRLVKSSFSRHLPAAPKDLWADSPKASEIANSVVHLRRTYIENAPVRAGLVKTAADWPFSSIHKARAQSQGFGVDVA